MIGLACSGGGSRAAAFHCGTLRALHDLKWLRSVDVVSTVSGGSVFGAAWLASIRRDETTLQFIARMRTELRRGFVMRAALQPSLVKLLLPGYNRTHLLGEAFGRLLLDDMELGDLPERPALVLNTTVLNHSHVGRFTRDGFATWNLAAKDQRLVSCRTRTSLGLATAASAAFPFGLPPVQLRVRDLKGAAPSELLAGHTTLHLTDGGVLENLGVQTLMKSRTYRCDQIVVSDAEVREAAWRPSLLGRAVALGAYLLSADTLKQLLTVMNGKQNRSMRELTVGRIQADAVAQLLTAPTPDVLAALQLAAPARLIMTRVDQDWDGFMRGVGRVARIRIAMDAECPLSSIPDTSQPSEVETWLLDVLPPHRRDQLDVARERYSKTHADAANKVTTNFTALTEAELDALARHAEWQVYASAAVYGGLEVRDAPSILSTDSSSAEPVG